MISNKNEKYLLKFIANANYETQGDNELYEIIYKLGIKPDFSNNNPIYQIIDEINYSEFVASRK